MNKEIANNELNELIDSIQKCEKECDDKNIIYNESKKFKTLLKALENKVIEVNKINNCYYHENTWIYDLYKTFKAKQPNITGQALTDWMANEFNKIDGIMVSNIDGDYRLTVITPYTLYDYALARGYNHKTTLYKTGKAKAHISKVNAHICELVYDQTREELNNNKGFGEYILDKPFNE